MRGPSEESEDWAKEQAFRAGLPIDRSNQHRTYAAGTTFVQRRRKARGPEEDAAYRHQKERDDLPLTLRERGYQPTKSVPVMDTINPKRAYSADEPSNALAFS